MHNMQSNQKINCRIMLCSTFYYCFPFLASQVGNGSDVPKIVNKEPDGEIILGSLDNHQTGHPVCKVKF
jgi:hypothetical protein